LDCDYHWQYLVRLLFWGLQLQKRKLVIVDTSGTIATTHSVNVAIRDTHRDIISPGMSIPGRTIRDAAFNIMGITGSMGMLVSVVAL
jgi:hypothetical protein